MRKLLLLALVLLCAGGAWAAPTQGLILIYNSKTESLDQHLQLAQELKKRRAAGHFKAKPQFSTAFAYCDANIPQMAKVLKALGLPGAATPVPYLAMVALDGKGRPTKVLWGENWGTVEEALEVLDKKLGLNAVAIPTPSPRTPAASGKGVALVGDSQNPDILAVYGATRKVLTSKFPQIKAGLLDKPYVLDFADASVRPSLEALGLRRAEAPYLILADFTNNRPTRMLWSNRVTDADLGVASLVNHVKAGGKPPEGKEITNAKDGSVLVAIPGGAFTMSNALAEDDEQPPHGVQLRPYYIGKTEVTNAQFARFVRETGFKTEAEKVDGAHLFVGGGFQLVRGASWDHPGGPGSTYDPQKPVVCVALSDALAYASWAGLRLPTEEEWEMAARGPEGRMYPWGNEWDPSKCCNSVGLEMGGAGGPQPVGSFPAGASPYGLLDMAGNVYEWTTSRYNKYPGSTYNSDKMDGVNIAIRGGSWGDPREQSYRGWNRTYSPPQVALSSVGFRVARDK